MDPEQKVDIHGDKLSLAIRSKPEAPDFMVFSADTQDKAPRIMELLSGWGEITKRARSFSLRALQPIDENLGPKIGNLGPEWLSDV